MPACLLPSFETAVQDMHVLPEVPDAMSTMQSC